MKTSTNSGSSPSRLLFSSMPVFLLLAVSCTATLAAAFEFRVGDRMGWHVPPPNNSDFYNQWASIHRFRIGDSLSFEYQNDSVLMVEKWDYYHCNSSDPIVAFNNGKGVMELDRAGPFYFISGFPDHCKSGQRLLVEVMSSHPIAPPPSAPPLPHADDGPSPSTTAGAAVPAPGPVTILLVAALGILLFSEKA